MIGIYKITNPKGKVYVGQSINIERRWYNYEHHENKGQPLLKRSFDKYGLDKHKFEIIEECLVEELEIREIFWTEQFNACHPLGLVLRVGGKNGYLSEETKNKIGDGNRGKIVTNETKKKLSLCKKGNLNMLGKTHSDKTKLKMSKSRLGKTDSEETKQKKSDSNKGRVKSKEWRQNISNSHPTKKPVTQFTLEGAKVKDYISINEASRQTGIRVGDISAVCNNKQKSAYGFIWKFKKKII